MFEYWGFQTYVLFSKTALPSRIRDETNLDSSFAKRLFSSVLLQELYKQKETPFTKLKG